MGIKYYYSAPQQIRLGTFIADAEGHPIYMFPETRFVKNLPRVTICSILDENKISFGYTTCTSKDQYRKRIGQTISKARAIKHPFKVVELENIKDVHSISEEVIKEIYELEINRIYS